MTATTIRVGPSASVITGPAPRRATGPIGALVGGAIALAVTVIGIWVDPNPPIGLIDVPFLAIGVPAAALVGALMGPSVRAQTGIAVPALAMATLTIAFADALMVAGFGLAEVLSPTGTDNPLAVLVGVGVLWLIGLVLVGVPMLAATVPCAVAWVLILRLLVRHGHGVAA